MTKSAGNPEASEKKPARTGGAVVIGALTMTSRVLGLVRDVLFATLFFGRALDAFALAFTVPNLFRRLFGEGALAGALVPALVKKIDEGDRKGAGKLAARSLGAVMTLLGIVAAGVVLVSVVVALALGTASKAGLIAGVLAVVMPYVVLICASAVLMAYLNASRHFAAPAAAPVLLNVALITMALLTYRSLGVWGLAIGVLAGGALQLLLQMIPATRRGMPALPRVDLADPDLRAVGRTLVPVVAGLAAFQVNVLLDRLVAEALIPGDGAVGALYLGNRLMQLPLAVFAIAIATAALPELSSRASRGDEGGFREALADAAGSILFWTVPAAVGLALLAEPVTALLFDRGAFLGAPGALAKTSLVVIFYAPGLVAFGVAALYARALYARGRQVAVVRAALWSVGVNVVLNLALVMLFQHVALAPALGESASSGEAGLALASSASGFVYLALLASSLRRPEWAARRGLILAGAALLAGAGAALATGLILASPPAAGAWEWLWRAPRLPAAVCVGGFAAVGVSLAGADRSLLRPVLRISLAAAGMGVFANLVLSSLPPVGVSRLIPVQRALAPVILGAGTYWFLAGFVALPEYERARRALGRALRRRGGSG